LLLTKGVHYISVSPFIHELHSWKFEIYRYASLFNIWWIVGAWYGFLISFGHHYCSYNAVRWLYLPQGELPITAIRVTEDGGRLWGGLQQWSWKVTECMGPTFRWLWHQWPKSQTKNLVSGHPADLCKWGWRRKKMQNRKQKNVV
jgi:hypothetical protein